MDGLFGGLATTRIVGANGEFVNGFNGSLDVHQRFGTILVNELFHFHTGVESILAVDASAGDTQMQLTDATGFNVGDHVQVNNGITEATFPEILAIVTNTITINQPLDNDFPDTTSNVEVVNPNINLVGSLASPISYVLQPESGEVWLISRILLNMTSTTPMDDAKFGGITALTNGVVLRLYDGATGTTGKLTVWQSNSDIILDMYDLNYSDKAPSGVYGLSGRGSFNRVGVEIKLDGTAGDYLEILVQDDLSGLDSFNIKGQGHIHDEV